MTAAISVTCRPVEGGHACEVVVGDDPAATRHTVTVTASQRARLAPESADPERLVHDSFVFLLEREPRESILRSFDLPVIERYFPGYEREIARRLQGRRAAVD